MGKPAFAMHLVTAALRGTSICIFSLHSCVQFQKRDRAGYEKNGGKAATYWNRKGLCHVLIYDSLHNADELTPTV
jgi:hypothetical protein